MIKTIWAEVRDGKIKPKEDFDFPEGTKAIVTFLSNNDLFWLKSSQISANTVWDNQDDDVYEELLEK